MSFLKQIVAFSLLLALLSGCASTQDPSTWSAKRFYDEARDAMEVEDYQSAIKYYEDLEIHHPFSPFAQQAQLEVIYAYYKYDEPESAIAAADRYIKLYPRAADVDYAYYLRGLVSFERGMGSLDLWLGLEADRRQPQSARNAYRYFEELIKRFPDSRYVADAKQRMLHLRNQLARYELNVADYYFRRGAYLSAANRAKYALENYPQTPAIPDALVIMIKAYRRLGVADLAADALEVMQLNYPDHEALNQLN
ncbi:hypothetical protein Tel_06630 [Candidatus Tenderia electrophaga]|jgi:outer membrane protein assembly factor BamD|uniref:Outer membrane protein assembly factor BamD n=1 Tax=Candidatus Tenderia electrophaga TaxID=1748243 RepID=A0A0S2TCI0_9GAMM|nr:hypothetical protein Tel_06630 [Candidatus Tenderia electrophaga]